MLRVQLPPVPHVSSLANRHVPLLREKPGTAGTLGTTQLRARRDRMRAVLGAIVDPPGLAEWLNGERLDLLTRGRALVKQIDTAWGGPLEKFELALNNLAAYHAECRREYQLDLQKSAEGVLEGPSPRVEVAEDMNPLTAKRLRWERQQKETHGCNYVDGRCTVRTEKERHKAR
jgi:hypothetical protein